MNLSDAAQIRQGAGKKEGGHGPPCAGLSRVPCTTSCFGFCHGTDLLI